MKPAGAVGQALAAKVATAQQVLATAAQTAQQAVASAAQTAPQSVAEVKQTVAAATQTAQQTVATTAAAAQQTAATAQQTVATAAATTQQTVEQAKQTAADAQTLFEAAREAELAKASVQAPPKEAKVAAVAVEPLKPRDALQAVRASRRLPTSLEQRIGRLAALDARIFLLVNGLPRSRPLNQFMVMLAIITNAGAAWIGVLAGMALANHSREARDAFLGSAPTVFGTAWLVEGPIKGRVRRKRPFLTIEEALVIGRRPKNWSFPSGHTASAFAAATIVATEFPQSSRPLYALASLIGFSRIYLGAHFPSDVLSGAAIGSISGLFVPPLLRAAWSWLDKRI